MLPGYHSLWQSNSLFSYPWITACSGRDAYPPQQQRNLYRKPLLLLDCCLICLLESCSPGLINCCLLRSSRCGLVPDGWHWQVHGCGLPAELMGTVFKVWTTPKVFCLGGWQISINCQTNDRGLSVMILTVFLWVHHLDDSRTYKAIKSFVYMIYANMLSCTPVPEEVN